MTAETEAPTLTRSLRLPRRSRPYAVQVALELVRSRQGAVGVAICGLLFLAAIFAPAITSHGPNEQFSGHRLEAPSMEFWFGTDEFSRDLWARVVFGLRSSLLIGFGAVFLGGIVGSLLGLLAGFLGGAFDVVVSRFVDAMLAFPAMVGAIAIITALGPGMMTLSIAIGAFNAPTFVRLARASALVERERDYVLAATSVGVPRSRILLAHIAPNAMAPLIVQFAFAVSFAILAEAGLSFLGLGIQPPSPSIGGALNASRAYMFQSMWYVILPTAAIGLLLTGMNLLADALNDVLDPRRRR